VKNSVYANLEKKGERVEGLVREDLNLPSPYIMPCRYHLRRS